jgi:hypothetical protein
MAFERRKNDDETKRYTPLTDPEFRARSLSPMTIEERRKWEVMFARFHQPHSEITKQIESFALPPGGEYGDALTTDGKGHYYWSHGNCYWKPASKNIYFATGNIAVGDIPNDTNTIYAKGNILVQSDSAQPYIKISNASDTARDPVIKFALGATPTVKFTMGVDDSQNDDFAVCPTDGLGASTIFSVSHTRENVLIGYNAGYSREDSTPYLRQSVAVGEEALYYSTGTDAAGLVAVGYKAGKANSSGRDNIYIGSLCGDSGGNFINGVGNIFIGKYVAFQAATSLQNNVFIGYSAGRTTTTGSRNSLIGDEAGATLTTGGYNTTIGKDSFHSLQTGDRNVGLGAYAGRFETGSDHLWIDNRARASLADGQGKALIYGTFADAVADQYLFLNGNISTPLPITSTLANGTAPFTLASTTVNTNLNADLLDGNHAAAFALSAHVHSFIDLDDVPANYAGAGGKIVKVKADASGLEFVAGGAGVANFTDLGDVPASYVGQEGLYVKVKATADGLEFASVSGTGAPTDAKYIVQEAHADLSAEQSLGDLATGVLKNTTTAGVGVLSIAPTGAYFDPDMPLASPAAQDDHFDDASIAAKWVPFQAAAAFSAAESDTFLKITHTTEAASATRGYYQALPAGDFTIVAKVHLISTTTAATFEFGICLYEDATSNPNTCDLELFKHSWGATVDTCYVNYYTDYDSWSASDGSLVVDRSYCYMRMRQNSTTWYFDISRDGISWQQVATRARRFVPAEFGMFTLQGNSGATLQVWFDWITYQGSDDALPVGGVRTVVHG